MKKLIRAAAIVALLVQSPMAVGQLKKRAARANPACASIKTQYLSSNDTTSRYMALSEALGGRDSNVEQNQANAIARTHLFMDQAKRRGAPYPSPTRTRSGTARPRGDALATPSWRGTVSQVGNADLRSGCPMIRLSDALSAGRASEVAMSNPMIQQNAQSRKFEEAARELECDEDETRWNERLKKIASQKPAEEPAEE